jgi:hypothetical protein
MQFRENDVVSFDRVCGDAVIVYCDVTSGEAL